MWIPDLILNCDVSHHWLLIRASGIRKSYDVPSFASLAVWLGFGFGRVEIRKSCDLLPRLHVDEKKYQTALVKPSEHLLLTRCAAPLMCLRWCGTLGCGITLAVVVPHNRRRVGFRRVGFTRSLRMVSQASHYC
jgi:hypothetical protein